MSEESKNIFDGDGGVKQVPLNERPKDFEQGDNKEGCDDCADLKSAIKIAPLSPTRFLQMHTPVHGILTEVEQTHKDYMAAKYTLYEKRANFYTKENRQKCKEETGKDTDKSFDEYFKQKHLGLVRQREEKEFRYEQAKRVFESLLK